LVQERSIFGWKLGQYGTLPGGLSWTKEGLQYLGVFLGDEMFMKKNFEGIVEKFKGRLNKWKFLLPKMS